MTNMSQELSVDDKIVLRLTSAVKDAYRALNDATAESNRITPKLDNGKTNDVTPEQVIAAQNAATLARRSLLEAQTELLNELLVQAALPESEGVIIDENSPALLALEQLETDERTTKDCG